MEQSEDNIIKHPSVAEPDKFETEFDAFVYHISHDVRASSRALTELPTWIEEDLIDAGVEMPKSVHESLRLMKRHTARLDGILSDLLTYSRIGRMQRTGNIEIAPRVATVLRALEIPSTFRVLTELDAQTVRMGNKDLERLLDALLSNPIKHRTQDTGLMRIETELKASTFRLTVSDDGPGIEPQYQARVFSMMTTLKPRDQVEGSGMGLPIARKIAEYYGGKISLHAPGREGGCTIIVELPQ